MQCCATFPVIALSSPLVQYVIIPHHWIIFGSWFILILIAHHNVLFTAVKPYVTVVICTCHYYSHYVLATLCHVSHFSILVRRNCICSSVNVSTFVLPLNLLSNLSVHYLSCIACIAHTCISKILYA
jgi:hypothetical protein